MQISKDGFNKLILREGSRTTAYKDTKGIWTIGVGHTARAGPPSPKAGMVLTEQEVKDLFAKDLVKFEKDVNEVFTTPVPQNVYDGAVSFHFNTGAIKTASWPKLYKQGKFAESKSHFLEWNQPPEIMGRRKSEASQIFDVPIVTSLPSQPSDPQEAPQVPTVPVKKQSWFTWLLKIFFLGHS
jgi:lysozyme